MSPLLSRLSGMASLGGSRLAIAFVSFAATALIARALGPEDFGVFSLLLGTYAYLAIAGEFGMRSIATSEASHGQSIAAVYPSYLRVRLTISAMALALTLPCVWWVEPNYLLEAALIMASVLIIPWQLDWVLIVKRHYALAAWATAARWLFWLALIGCAMLLNTLNLAILAGLFLLSWVLGNSVSILLVKHKNIRLHDTNTPDPHNFGSLIALGWPVFGMTIITQVLLNADLLWIGHHFGAESAGYYYLATAIVTAGLIFANAMGQIANSEYARLRDNPEAVAHKLVSDLRLVGAIALALALGLYFVAPPLLPLIFGDEYQPAIAVVLALIPYAVTYHLYTLYYFAGIALGWQHRFFKASLITVITLPVLLIWATQEGSLLTFAIAKCLMLVIAIITMLVFTPAEYRRNAWPWVAIYLGILGFLALILEAI